ncbi:MAG: L-idonate 5-dehydrogenase [Rhodobacteraceae bacterium]|nr:L-idonate 5-dehydrogenase [Paracoccaceae bacterium]
MRAIVIHDAKDLRLEPRELEAVGLNEVRVSLAAGGICGSDLHYYNHGGFGAIRLKQPMILGHEVSGHVAEVGAEVEGLTVGDLVAVSPSRPCGSCRFCVEGLRNQCLNMRFYGSAMPFPHIQGAFREQLVCHASQCVQANGISVGEAAMAEPLSVCLHATRRAGDLLGKRVLVTGCGPIGSLSVLAARRAGAAEIVATDLMPNALSHASAVGADRVINVGEAPDSLDAYGQNKGYFDFHYECSGAPQALAMGVAALRPRGVILQLGLSGDMSIPMMQLTAKEIDLRGSFRFHEEFEMAVDLMRNGGINVKPLITHTLPLDEVERAFQIAGDRTQAMKAQIAFA